MSGRDTCLQVTLECPIEASIYGYWPSLAPNAFFVAYFALFFLINVGLGVHYKTWTYSIILSCACLIETLGYGGRIMLHDNPFNKNGFIMQICCLVFGPAFNSGALYLTLKYITLTFGAEFSRIKPYLYTWIFIGGDFIALILQAIGGAMASTSGDNETQLKNGDNIAMAGIAWQVFTLVAFAVATADFLIRRTRSAAPLSVSAATLIRDIKFRVFAGAMVLAWLTVFTRCVYRIAEFAQGWGNPIMKNETYFIVLEGVMIVIATFCQTIPHPGFCFPALSSQKRVHQTSEEKAMESSDESSRDVSVSRK